MYTRAHTRAKAAGGWGEKDKWLGFLSRFRRKQGLSKTAREALYSRDFDGKKKRGDFRGWGCDLLIC